ncbi:MAG: hypothetical protein U9O98_02765, partial [Asgard group archaeon]|nr:hypothetical protein [Asgard group archaeon]
ADMNKLDQYPKPQGVPSMHSEPVLLLLLLICLPPIGGIVITYLKFNKFHNYLKYHPIKSTHQVASGLKALLISLGGGILSALVSTVFSFLSQLIAASGGNPQVIFPIYSSIAGLVGLVSLGLSIWSLILHYQWQEAMNDRIRIERSASFSEAR